MTQFEVNRTSAPARGGRCAPSYAPGGIMALEGGALTMLGLMPSEIRRTKPGSTRGGYAKGFVHKGWQARAGL
jgi:hypothetical protein